MLAHRGIVTGGPPALYSPIDESVRLRSGTRRKPRIHAL